MSGDSDCSGVVEIAVPQKHVSAQVLQQMTPPRHTGFLRKRGKRERILENIRFARSLFASIMRWRQRFVIVSHGCIYVYASETSSSPLQTLSLRGYNRLIKMESEQSPWTFRVIAPDDTVKAYYFACHSDNARKEWMTALREELVLANDVKEEGLSSGSLSSDIYVYLQRPVFEPPTITRRSIPPVPGDDSDSDNDDYDKIDDKDLAKMRPRIPLPPTPNDQSYTAVQKTPKREALTPKKKADHDYINRPKNIQPPPVKSKPATKPKPKPKANPVSRSPSEAEYYFAGRDRDQALTALREKGRDKGTYLVRDSRAGDNKVLAVMTEDDIKEYKILQKAKQFTINNRDYYKSVEDLLMAYQAQPLPNRTTTLTRGFGSMQNIVF